MPLYRFVMNNVLGQFDLDRADGRVSALREAAPLVASIRDQGMVTSYARELAGRLGMDEEEVRREVMRAAASSSRRTPAPVAEQAQGRGRGSAAEQGRLLLPEPADRMLATERETAKLLVQVPHLFGPGWDGLSVADFTHGAYAAVFTSVEKAAAAGEESGDWIHRVESAAEHDLVRSLVVSLAVEALPVHGEVTARFVIAHALGLQLLTVMRQIAQLKGKLQRTNPVESPTSYNQMFSELVVLEARRKDLQNRSLGAQD